jgi:hypothetical protein
MRLADPKHEKAVQQNNQHEGNPHIPSEGRKEQAHAL